ncbi:MAG: D-xylose transporter XylE [Paludibacter sp.]|jgi:SP family xylose:H+ symportor-like MFS transporter|nr:D-xylose transporter XylE [Paludibacter sp.]
MSTSKNPLYLTGITLVATLGGLLFGYDTAVISGTVSSLRVFFVDPMGLSPDLANAMEGFIVSSALIGCVIGASIAGFVSQKFGRKPSLQIAAVLFLLSAIGSAWPEMFFGMPGTGDHSFASLFIFYRIIGGIGVGMASMVSPMYIAEVAPHQQRGALVSWNQFAIIFGMLVVYFVNYGIALQGDGSWLNTIGWRWMFASEIIPATLFLIFLFVVPETPRWLVMNDKKDKARTILVKLVGTKEAEVEIDDIQRSLDLDATQSLKPYYQFLITWILLFSAAFIGLKYAGNSNAFEISLIGSFVIALIAPVRSFGFKIIAVGVLLSAFQQFVGINVVLYYAPEIFKSMGSGTDTALLQTIIVGVINLSFTVLAILTVDKFGRRPLLIIGALVMAVAMTGLGTGFAGSWSGGVKLFFMLLYTAGFAMSWGPVCWVMLAEIFPNSVRSSVMSIAVAAQWVANFLVSWTFPMMNKNEALVNQFNHGFSYWVYGLMGILAAVFIWKMVPETKGKTLEEMNKLWKK